jgi:CheY-like chemotaxis protein
MRILIVDDEPTVRRTNARVLRAQGHEVTVAESGLAALTAVATEPRFDLVVTDLEMQGMSGNELAQSLAAMQYPARRLCITSRDANFVRLDLFTGHLTKPHTAGQLVAFVQG